MKLFLASDAKHPTSMKAMEAFVDGFSGKRIAYIPTAANGTFYGSWKDGNGIKTALSLPATVDIIELENGHYTDVITPIKTADIIWMAGGMSGYLLYWIRRTELDKALPEILDKGTIYVGSSAGSMVCSTTQNLGDWYIGETEPGASLIPGLGLIDFEIYPHFEDGLYEQILRKWGKGKLYLLKNDEVITIDNGALNVLGEARLIEK